MKTLLAELSARLQALGCAFTDRYNGQPLHPNQMVVFDLPAAFLELMHVRWEPAGGNLVRGLLQLRIHVVQQRLDDSHLAGSALSSYDLPQQLATQLHGWKTTQGHEWVLVQQRFANQYTHFITDVLEFQCRIQACALQPD